MVVDSIIRSIDTKTSARAAIFLAALTIGAVFAGSVVFAGGAVATGDAPEAGATIDTIPAQENTTNGSVSFADNSTLIEIAQGDPIRTPYTVQFDNASEATIVMTGARSSNQSYWSNVTIQDADGNGWAQLHINTWEAGHTNPFEVESGEITRWDQDEFEESDDVLNKTKDRERGAYDLLLQTGSDPEATLDSFSSVAKLSVQEGETEPMDSGTAPRGELVTNLDELYDEEGAFPDHVQGFSKEGDTNLSAGGVVFVTPFGGGYYGAAEYAMETTAEDGEPNSSAAVQWLLDEGHYEFGVEQTDGEKTLDVERAIAQDAFAFDSGLQYYHLLFAIDTNAAVFENGDGEYVQAEAGETYEVSFAKQHRIDQMDPNTNRTVYEEFALHEPVANVERVQNEDGTLAINGSSSLSPGTELTLDVQADDGSTEVTTVVDQFYGPREGIPQNHSWNATAELDADPQNVEIGVSAPEYGELQTNVVDTTTTTDGTADTTTGDGNTTTGETTPGDDGGGGMIPGFTGGVALVAVILVTLVAVHRE